MANYREVPRTHPGKIMKNTTTEMPSKGEIAIYRTKGNKIQLDVKLE